MSGDGASAILLNKTSTAGGSLDVRKRDSKGVGNTLFGELIVFLEMLSAEHQTFASATSLCHGPGSFAQPEFDVKATTVTVNKIAVRAECVNVVMISISFGLMVRNYFFIRSS